MLQVYNSQMQPLYLEDKKIVHQKGLWHKVFAGILYNKTTHKIYFQTIFPKESYTFNRDDFIDFSVGGHVEEKENILNAALRETKEELGLNITLKDLCFLGIRICNCDLSATYKIREFQYFYAISTTDFPNNISFKDMDNEVKSIVEVDIDDYINLLLKQTDKIKAHEFLLDHQNQTLTPNPNITIGYDRIVPDYFTDKSILEKFFALKAFMAQEI